MDFQQAAPEEQRVSSALPPSGKHSVWVKFVAVILLVAISYVGGLKMGSKGYVFAPKSFQVVNQQDQPKVVDYNLLWNAIDLLNTKSIEKPIDQQKVLYGAISGAVGSLGDPYTTFFTPKDLKSFQTTLKGSFGGIGAEIGQKNGNTVIIAPLDGTPAQRAGLLAQDIIAGVNGTSTQGQTVEQVVDLIRGTPGTSVKVTIVRQGKDKPFDVTLTREIIQVKSVKWTYKDVQANGQTKHIAVITLSQFGDDTKGLFDQAVNEIVTKHVDGIVLDVRNNPGGYLQTAVDIGSNWIKEGDVIVTEAHSDGTSQAYNAEGNNRLSNIKTVVLINGGSASAAEILSGALHDHNIAELIGEKSFGKGSVQQLFDLSDGSALKITIAKWITPGGKNLNHDGLNPDVPVKFTEQDVSASKDPQMDKALEEVIK